MKKIPAILGWLLVIIAFALYLIGIAYAIITTFKTPPGGLKVDSLPAPLDIILSTLGAILLTNLGAVLGIAVTDKTSALAGVVVPSKPKPGFAPPPPPNMREQVQLAAVLVYVAGLLACSIAWGFRDFKTDPKDIVAIIPQQGKTLVGVITAYVAFVLGVKP